MRPRRASAIACGFRACACDGWRPAQRPRERTVVELSVRTRQGDRLYQFVADARPSYHVGARESPNVTLLMRFPTLLRIISGKLDGIVALAQGTMKVRGNILTARVV